MTKIVRDICRMMKTKPFSPADFSTWKSKIRPVQYDCVFQEPFLGKPGSEPSSGRFRTVLPSSIPNKMAIKAAPSVGRKCEKLADQGDEDADGEAGQNPIQFFLSAFIFMSANNP